MKFLLLPILLISLSVFSQENISKKHGVSIGYGQSFLFGDFSDLGDEALKFDLYYQYQASYTFQLLVNFHSNEFEKGNQEIEVTSFNASIKAKLYDLDSFAPYLLGGLGLYMPKAKRSSGSQVVLTDSETVFGLNLGAGMDLKLNESFTAGFLAHYHFPSAVESTGQTDLDGSYMKLMLLGTYYFL
jgi:opacity protein-like surface antigen